MKLVTYSQGGSPRLGVVTDSKVVDLAAAHVLLKASRTSSAGVDPRSLNNMLAFLQAGEPARRLTDEITGSAATEDASPFMPPLSEVQIHAPVLNPVVEQA